jgi:tryptophan-rich sensory protein
MALAQSHAPTGTIAAVLICVLVFVVIFGSLFGQDSRPQWRDVNRRPRFRASGSMRPSEWPRDERDR